MGMLLHDARGPLSWLTLALEPGADDELDAALLDMAQTQLRQLTELVEDMARVQRGLALPPRRGPVRVDRLLAQLADEIRRSRPTLRVEVETPVVTLSTDPNGLRRVLENLTRNAGRHAASHVHLWVVQDGADLSVRVTDDGAGLVGVSPESVFEPHVRGRGSDGQGLGLAIARMIAEQLGGEVILVPDATHTRFELRLSSCVTSVEGSNSGEDPDVGKRRPKTS